MKSSRLILMAILLLTFGFINGQSVTKNLIPNKKLIPQEIEYDGKPDLQYLLKNKNIVLDYWDEPFNEKIMCIRMKLNNKEVIFKMQKKNLSKAKRVYFNNEYTVTFFNIIYGECLEGAQNVTGKLLIESKTEQNTIVFKGYDSYYYNKNCK
jgi:hypothetical protein